MIELLPNIFKTNPFMKKYIILHSGFASPIPLIVHNMNKKKMQ